MGVYLVVAAIGLGTIGLLLGLTAASIHYGWPESGDPDDNTVTTCDICKALVLRAEAETHRGWHLFLSTLIKNGPLPPTLFDVNDEGKVTAEPYDPRQRFEQHIADL